MKFENLIYLYLSYFSGLEEQRLENFENLLRHYENKRILDCAVGTGALTLEMLEKGYQFDCSDGCDQMLAVFQANASAKQLKINTKQICWMSLGQLYPESYDLIICKGNSLAYLNTWNEEQKHPEHDELKICLQSFYDALSPNGEFYLDFPAQFHTPKYELNQEYPEKDVYGYRISMSERIFTCQSKKQRLWEVDMHINGEPYNFSRRSLLLSRDRIVDLMAEIGFKEVRTSKTIDQRNHYQAVIAQK